MSDFIEKSVLNQQLTENLQYTQYSRFLSLVRFGSGFLGFNEVDPKVRTDLMSV